MKRKGLPLLRGLPLLFVTAFLIYQAGATDAVAKATAVSASFFLPRSEKTPIVVSDKERTTGAPSNEVADLPSFTAFPTVSVENLPAPKQGKGGKVVEKQMAAGDYLVGKIAVKNNAGKKLDIAKEFSVMPSFRVLKTAAPQVLILHTHTTECFLEYDAGFYNDSDKTRTRDTEKNVVAVGEAIAEELRAAGFGVIHDTTEHDYPQYTGAYTRSLATGSRVVKQYPSIVAVLDIHRDSIGGSGSDKIKPTVTVGGRKAAQMMILTSVSHSTDVPHPDWRENLRFALQLQNRLNEAYDGLMRPLNLVGARYNQHLAPGSLLLEVGSEVNTLSEAVYSGKLFGRQMAGLLKDMQTEG